MSITLQTYKRQNVFEIFQLKFTLPMAAGLSPLPRPSPIQVLLFLWQPGCLRFQVQTQKQISLNLNKIAQTQEQKLDSAQELTETQELTEIASPSQMPNKRVSLA
jgi:hypothetical protein